MDLIAAVKLDVLIYVHIVVVECRLLNATFWKTTHLFDNGLFVF